MTTELELKEKLNRVFTVEQSGVLATVIHDTYNYSVRVSDFRELKEVVGELAEAQKRTETSVDVLTKRMDELAVAQKRTETSVDALTKRMDELAVAQKRTETSVDVLTKRMDDLAMLMKEGFQKVNEQITALGSRWGIMNEKTFRRTVQALLSRAGYTVSKGIYGDREVDVVIKNGEHILLEITSAAVKKDVRNLTRSAEDYFEKTGIEPKLMISAIYIPPTVMREITDSPRRIEIFTYEDD